jgi:TRAP-type C4-dicarboxylate transport system substrate-binding protein
MTEQTKTAGGAKRWMGNAAAVAATAAIMSGAGAANAQELRYSFGFPTSFATYPSIERYAEQITAETGMEMRVFAASLLSPTEMMAGLRDGLADVGWDAAPYNPVEMSESALIADLSMLITAGDVPEVPGAAMTGAVLEYILFNCDDCIAQFDAQNVVYTAGTGTTPYYLICTEPLTSLADLAGKRIRTAAGNFERWSSAVGASGVAMPGNETYDALAQGVLNCTSNDLSQLIGQRLVDVAKQVTVGVPGGVYGGSTTANWNKNVWQGLSVEDRTAILRITARYVADTVVAFHDATDVSIEQAIAEGAVINEADDELKAATAAFVEADMATIEQQYTERYGLQNVPEKVALASELIEKWKQLVMDTPSDIDALEQIYWDEIYSKLDPETFGMN